jgi:hypothetical protein
MRAGRSMRIQIFMRFGRMEMRASLRSRHYILLTAEASMCGDYPREWLVNLLLPRSWIEQAYKLVAQLRS